MIGKVVLKDYKKRHTNLSIDYRKAYDVVPHTWINECMEMFEIVENLRKFLQKSMQQLRLLLTANGEDLGEVNVKREIFQGDREQENSLGFYVANLEGNLIRGLSAAETINTRETNNCRI